jgi:hypothetical protein
MSTYAEVRKRLAEQRQQPAQPEIPGAPEQLSAKPPEHCMRRLQQIRAEIAKRYPEAGENQTALPPATHEAEQNRTEVRL